MKRRERWRFASCVIGISFFFKRFLFFYCGRERSMNRNTDYSEYVSWITQEMTSEEVKELIKRDRPKKLIIENNISGMG